MTAARSILPAAEPEPAEPPIHAIGRDPPGYRFCARAVVRRCFAGAGVNPARKHRRLAELLEGDIRHELATAYAAGAESVWAMLVNLELDTEDDPDG